MYREKEPIGMEKDKDRSKPGAMGFTVERVSALSDGVFAVAITLLVLSIAVPTIRGTVTNSKLAHGLAQVWPHFFAYVLSFVIIGMFWISHHALFSVIRRVDRTLIWMNMFYLLLIVFMPYPTNLLSLYGQTMVATVMYAAVLGAAGLLQAAMGFYATRGHRLVDDEFDLRYAGEYLRNSLIMFAVFIISIGIAFASPTAAQYFWIALFTTPLLERLIFRKERGEPGVEAQEAV
jgi:uncharacterized membrane protein